MTTATLHNQVLSTALASTTTTSITTSNNKMNQQDNDNIMLTQESREEIEQKNHIMTLMDY